MIVHDSLWSNGSALSTIIDYHEPFDQGLKPWPNGPTNSRKWTQVERWVAKRTRIVTSQVHASRKKKTF